jgi:hypothetical protein
MKILISLVAVILVGCGVRVSSIDIDGATHLCKDLGGLSYMIVTPVDRVVTTTCTNKQWFTFKYTDPK